MRRRVVRVTRLGAVTVVAAAVVPWFAAVAASADAIKSAPPSGDTRAIASAGNVTTCTDLGLGGDAQVDDGNLAGSGFTVTTDATDQNLSVTAVPAGSQIDAFVVKGGDGYNLYGPGAFTPLPAQGLHAPLVGNPPTIVPTISHWFLCTGPAAGTRPVVVAPTATLTGSCTDATAALDAGSSDTDFVVTRAGDTSGLTVAVPAGGVGSASVSLDAQHPSVSVTVGATTLASFARAATCDTSLQPTPQPSATSGGTTTTVGGSTTPPGQPAPTVSGSTACDTGLTVELGDLDGSVPVTFTVTTPAGATEKVAVHAGKVVKRSYAATGESTGPVAVSAPGLTTQTFAAADPTCTQVLGEKVTRTVKHAATGTVAAKGIQTRRAPQLPFTGFPAGRALGLGAVLTAAGVAMTLTPRRRYLPKHAAR